jgi:hypothetical protein
MACIAEHADQSLQVQRLANVIATSINKYNVHAVSSEGSVSGEGNPIGQQGVSYPKVATPETLSEGLAPF